MKLPWQKPPMPEAPAPEPMLTPPKILMACAAVAFIALLREGSTLSKNYMKMASRGKRNVIISTVGMLASIVACLIEPGESYLSVDTAMMVGLCVFGSFSALFLFGAEFFFADNFTAKPKDNFGIVFCRMFGLQGLYTLWLGLELTPAKMLPYFAIFNAAIIFVGPQRGEMLLPTNEKHIVPHIGTTAAGLAMLATLP